jgi:hypothetical protein
MNVFGSWHCRIKTMNVANFCVNITKIEQSHKKHYEKVRCRAYSKKISAKNVHLGILNATGITASASQCFFLVKSEHFNYDWSSHKDCCIKSPVPFI